MTPAALADLHTRCFVTPRPWSAAEFETLLHSPGVFLETTPQGFALGRMAGPEAELLTLAVAPDARRQGSGRALLMAFEQTARSRRGADALLEVAADNRAARALYADAGYEETGRRTAYYQCPDGTRLDALVLGKSLELR